MKGTLLILFYTTVALTYTELDGFYPNGCPKDTSIDKFLPDENNCDQYFQCFHGAVITRFCPSGLHFNADLEKCDWHAESNCHLKQEETKRLDTVEELDSDNPSHAVLICATPQSNGVLVSHENCNEFYKCSYGKPVALKCARDLLYNPVNEKCDWPHNVDCGERAVATNESLNTVKRENNLASNIIEDSDANSDPSRADALCSSKRFDGRLIAHEYCNKFYKCVNGKPVAMKCPVDLLFNTNKEHCDWPRNVNCNNRIFADTDDINSNTIIDGNSTESDEIDDDDDNTPAVICATQNSEGILIAHEKCNYFFKCMDQKPVPFKCPENLLFNTRINYCDWPKKVSCGERYLGYDSENDIESENATHGIGPSQAAVVCSAPDSDDTLVAHKSCDHYYKCHDGNPVKLQCPGNLLFNAKKEFCDWPTDVDCGERIIPENSLGDEKIFEIKRGITETAPDSFDPSDPSVICAAENSNGGMIPHENCNQFYKCHQGKAIALFCQLNLYYNPAKGYCDWQRNVICGDRIIPGEGSVEDDSNNADASCQGNVNGNVAPHENCSQFYKCVNGQTYPMDCPPGLYFNTLLKICDWPMNVDCGDRLTETQVLAKHWMNRRAIGVAVLPTFTQSDDDNS